MRSLVGNNYNEKKYLYYKEMLILKLTDVKNLVVVLSPY